VGKALERLKPHYVCNWLKEVSKTHLEVILSCLLPHPVEYARVGGHWYVPLLETITVVVYIRI